MLNCLLLIQLLHFAPVLGPLGGGVITMCVRDVEPAQQFFKNHFKQQNNNIIFNQWDAGTARV